MTELELSDLGWVSGPSICPLNAPLGDSDSPRGHGREVPPSIDAFGPWPFLCLLQL